MLDSAGVMQMPKQEVAEGQKHGYIGEDTGEVKIVEAPEAGSSNVVPDVGSAQARVDALELELKKAQRVLAEAKMRQSKEPTKPTEKPIVGTAAPAAPATSATSTATPGPAKTNP